jgi:hypothetical protein
MKRELLQRTYEGVGCWGEECKTGTLQRHSFYAESSQVEWSRLFGYHFAWIPLRVFHRLALYYYSAHLDFAFLRNLPRLLCFHQSEIGVSRGRESQKWVCINEGEVDPVVP